MQLFPAFNPRSLGHTFLALVVGACLAACEERPQRVQTTPSIKEPPIAGIAGSAQQLFSSVRLPAAMAGPSVIGGYSRGCLARAQALPIDGAHWQVMRISRNRNWGHPSLIAFIKELAEQESNGPWRGLLVGDLGQPRGGPSPTGHASHQIGLDVDIWLTPMPARRYSDEERETTPALSVLQPQTIRVDGKLFTPAHAAFIKRAAQFTEVERIFVNPGIKKALCQSAGRDRSWLGKVRPWPGHDEHIHVRLSCPADEAMCQNQDPPPAGDGCGAELTSWLKNTDWLPGNRPEPRMQPIPMSALPETCAQVVQAPDLQQTVVHR
jgi:penicillin-insensitive murein DD-endopeptidase